MVLTLSCCSLIHSQSISETTAITITKTWSQEPNGWTYPMAIHVPAGPEPTGGFPVCILLHGFGGNGGGMVNAWESDLPCHILIGPTGYNDNGPNNWNISNEPSEAPDTEMIDDLVSILQGYDNINPNQIRILGSSNGASLANRVFVENTNPGVDIICAVVSQLTEANYHDGQFHYPSGMTDSSLPYSGYDTPTVPILGRRHLSICNTNDGVIPYYGGGFMGLNFLDAQLAIYLMAQHEGYTGSQLSSDGVQLGTSTVYEYSYLDGQVVHLRGDAGHSTNQTQKDYITEYFNVQCGTCDAVVSLNGTLTSGVYTSSESLTSEASIPANNTVSMLSDTICLGNGFSVEAGTELLIEVDPCN